MGLYKRKDSHMWWMSFRINGSRIFESTGTLNRKLAEKIHAKRLTEISEGRWLAEEKKTPEKVLFSDFAVLYLKWAERQRAFRGKKSKVKQLLKTFASLSLSSITTRAVEEYQTMVLAVGKTPATANRHVAILKHMFTKAVSWEMVDDEVLKKVRSVKLLQEHNKRLRYLSKAECQTLINACAPHLKPIVITALCTGMRKGEILPLEWKRHVDLEHGFILLDMTKNGERREIPINKTLREIMEGLAKDARSSYVFTDENGNRYGDVKRSFYTACKKAGITDFRFHDLRHTFASQLVMNGVDLTTIKELLGHKTLAMTLRYAHLAPGHKVKAVETLDVQNGYVLVTVGVDEGLTHSVTS